MLGPSCNVTKLLQVGRPNTMSLSPIQDTCLLRPHCVPPTQADSPHQGHPTSRTHAGEGKCRLFFSTPVLLSWGCSNKGPQTGCLQTRDLFSHRWGAQKSEIKLSAGASFLWRLQGRLFHCLFQLLVAPGISRLVLHIFSPLSLEIGPTGVV